MGHRTLAIAVYVSLASTVCSAVRWDWQYHGDGRPEQALSGIKFYGDLNAATPEDGALHLANEAAHGGLWAVYVVRDIGALNSRGVTIEARVKVVASGGEHCVRPGIQLFIADSHCAEAVVVGEGYVETRYSVMRHEMDTTSDYHVYRMAARGDDYRVYVDGKLAINGQGRYLGTRTNRHRLTWLDTVRFGAGTKYARAEGYIDFLRYTTAGAFAPDGTVDAFDALPKVGTKVEIAPVPGVLSGMAAGLNEYDASMPKLGGEVTAPILCKNDRVLLWLQDATTKVFRRDTVAPTPADPGILDLHGAQRV